MRKSSTPAFFLVALLGSASTHAATLIPVPAVPGSTGTYLGSINDQNLIAGDYVDADGKFHAFYGTLGGQYTTFDFDENDYPGTIVRGIDDKGDMVGVADVDNDTVNSVQFERFASGAMKLIVDHHTPLDGLTGGINSKGIFATENWNPDSSVDGFLGKKGKITSQVDLGFAAIRVRPRQVTLQGDVIGYTKVTNSVGYQGFILHAGTTTLINYPDENATQTLFEGANSKGIVSGFWEDSNFNQFGFYYDSVKAKFVTITIPGYPQASVGGVNSAGLIAIDGYTSDFSQGASYVYCPRKPSRCPAGGFEIADAKPVALVPGFKPHAVLNPAALTPLKAKLQLRQ